MSTTIPAEPRIVGFFILKESLMGNLMQPNPPPGKTNWFAQLIPEELEARRHLHSEEGPVARFIKIWLIEKGCNSGHISFMGSDNPTLEEICQIIVGNMSVPIEDTTDQSL